MSSVAKGIFIVGAKRTPFGSYGGKLTKTTACDLQVVAAKAALASANLKPELVDSVNIGHVLSNTAADGIFIARHVQLKTGIPIEKPALHVNRLCGSGFQAIINGIQDISLGLAEISLTGGTENMSQSPHTIRNLRFGVPLGQPPEIEDSLWVGLTDTYCKLSMALTAEKLGASNNITREECDRFALRSQQLWKEGDAHEAQIFKEELVPVTVQSKQPFEFCVDEHPRPQTTFKKLRGLKTIFKENGLVTAGSASGICDGAGAVVVASEEAVAKNNLRPLARIVAFSAVGVEPSIMGIGPVPAIQNVLKLAGKTLNDIDLVEINEAFAAQTLACAKQLKLDINKLNVNGGAIAIGHPLGASGARITAHLVHELRRRKGKYGIGSACIGGGQGIALLIESL